MKKRNMKMTKKKEEDKHNEDKEEGEQRWIRKRDCGKEEKEKLKS